MAINKDLEKLVGKKISCSLEGYTLDEAVVVKHIVQGMQKFYIIHNNMEHLNGGPPPKSKMQGYIRGWFLGYGDNINKSLKDIKILNHSSIYELW